MRPRWTQEYPRSMLVLICHDSLANPNYNDNPKRLTQDVHVRGCPQTKYGVTMTTTNPEKENLESTVSADNGMRILQLYEGHRLSMANTNCQHKCLHGVTWRPPTASQSWTNSDDVVINYRREATSLE
ncbi:hypothetical protein CLF_109456 [Clonorchis sinensis]|uniref:Uncharacterized protein n=1 Tax=Clonorchis sinensis TaxID=79923 RepID=G7YSM7_CLOSI|nr:hypothetical protein CLF_109456 [Clonorchis sinensis]